MIVIEVRMTDPDHDPPRGLTWLDDSHSFELCFDAGGQLVAKHERAGFAGIRTPSSASCACLACRSRARLESEGAYRLRRCTDGWLNTSWSRPTRCRSLRRFVGSDAT